MEALERLEAVHAHLRLLHSHSLSTPNPPSNRFLADFLLFLGETCKTPEQMERGCGVLMDALPEMLTTSLFHDLAGIKTIGAENLLTSELQVASRSSPTITDQNRLQQLMDKKENIVITSPSGETPRGREEAKLCTTRANSSSYLEDFSNGLRLPLVALKDMERAQSTVEDFKLEQICIKLFVGELMEAVWRGMAVKHVDQNVLFHVPRPGCPQPYPCVSPSPNSYLRWRFHLSGIRPTASAENFTKTMVSPFQEHELDEKNEDQLRLPLPSGKKDLDNVFPSVHTEKSDVQPKGLGRDPFANLKTALDKRNLLTKRIEDELCEGLQYWELEQSLCTALSQRYQVKVEDVMRAIQLKSFDYRVLNLLMYLLCNQPVNESHFQFLCVSELLVEIADDLFDYEEDVAKNSFNVLRLFLYIYGPREAPTMLAKFIGDAEATYQELLEGLESNLQARYRRRCEEAVVEGGSKSNHVLGSWTIPPLIVDEDAYRQQIYGGAP